MTRNAFALQSLQSNAVGFGVMLLDRGEQAEVLGCGSEQVSVLSGFVGLFGKFGFRSAIPVLACLLGELRIHGGEFVGFAFDGEFQAAAEKGLFLLIAEAVGVLDHQFGME